MIISNKLQGLIGEALKAHDEIRLSTLRLLSSAMNYEKIAKQHDLTEEEEVAVIRREAKKRKDAIEIYSKLRNERTEEIKKKEAEELKILEEFLPQAVPEEELSRVVDTAVSETGASSLSDMGKVIGLIKAKFPSEDGSRIAELVKRKLNHD